MKVIIIEDEKLSAEHLENLLKRIDESIEVAGIFDSVKKSKTELFKENNVDVLFLDIHLADGLSFDIFKEIQIDTPVIFTTAYSNYAIQAFELNSIDYLVKPIGIEDLKKALIKLKTINDKMYFQAVTKFLPLMDGNLKKFKSKFLVKLGENLTAITTANIHHFLAEDGIVLLINKEGKRFPVDFTLDQLENELDPGLFFRINRKVLIEQSNIEKMSTFFNGRLKIQTNFLNDECAIVSRERVSEFKHWIERSQ